MCSKRKTNSLKRAEEGAEESPRSADVLRGLFPRAQTGSISKLGLTLGSSLGQKLARLCPARSVRLAWKDLKWSKVVQPGDFALTARTLPLLGATAAEVEESEVTPSGAARPAQAPVAIPAHVASRVGDWPEATLGPAASDRAWPIRLRPPRAASPARRPRPPAPRGQARAVRRGVAPPSPRHVRQSPRPP